MKREQVINCMFSRWYPKFKHLSIKSHIIPLPVEFIDYLNSDGVVLPKESIQGQGQSQEEEEEWDMDTPHAKPPSFPQFEAQIKKSIATLGGKVFPKLNWSAPRDATWIAFDHTLKCTNPSDIYLLLKSSEFVMHDLNEPFVRCDDSDPDHEAKVQYEMVLRKWLDLKPGLEFRCFIKKNKLIGISQRHPCDFFPFLGKDNGAILEDIKLFFYNKIYKQFPDENYVFDVYRKSEHNILLLDFNPFGPVTDGLLFEWEELDSWPDGDSASEEVPEPVFRFIETEMGVKPSPYQQHGMPVDMVDLAAGTDPHKLIDFLQMKIQSQQDDSSGEDDSSSDKPEEDMSNVLAKRTDGDSKDIDNSDSKTCSADSITIS